LDAEGKKSAAVRLDSGRKCPKCGKALLLRSSARGEFLGCGGFPKCKTIVKVSPEEIAEIKKAAGA
jgi:ssDNA-binding Zn-finger/Zn-ribbon topoisomerase 1